MALLSHPDIKEAIVLPVHDKEYGARPVAVIKAPSMQVQVTLNNFLQDELEKYKWPIAYFIMPDSLIGESGIKLSRAKVKEWLAQYQSDYVPFN